MRWLLALTLLHTCLAFSVEKARYGRSPASFVLDPSWEMSPDLPFYLKKRSITSEKLNVFKANVFEDKKAASDDAQEEKPKVSKEKVVVDDASTEAAVANVKTAMVEFAQRTESQQPADQQATASNSDKDSAVILPAATKALDPSSTINIMSLTSLDTNTAATSLSTVSTGAPATSMSTAPTPLLNIIDSAPSLSMPSFQSLKSLIPSAQTDSQTYVSSPNTFQISAIQQVPKTPVQPFLDPNTMAPPQPMHNNPAFLGPMNPPPAVGMNPIQHAPNNPLFMDPLNTAPGKINPIHQAPGNPPPALFLDPMNGSPNQMNPMPHAPGNSPAMFLDPINTSPDKMNPMPPASNDPGTVIYKPVLPDSMQPQLHQPPPSFFNPPLDLGNGYYFKTHEIIVPEQTGKEYFSYETQY